MCSKYMKQRRVISTLYFLDMPKKCVWWVGGLFCSAFSFLKTWNTAISVLSEYYFCTCIYRNKDTIEKTFVLIITDKRNRIHTTSRIMNMQTGNAKTRIWHPRHSETDTQLPGTVILKTNKKKKINSMGWLENVRQKEKKNTDMEHSLFI